MSAEKTKIFFEVDPESWHGHSSESLWAERKGPSTYQLMNIPFFAKNVSFGDVVAAKKARDGKLWCHRVVRHSGHTTCRIVTKHSTKGGAVVETQLSKLARQGCQFEKGSVQDLLVFAVDIPHETDLSRAVAILEEGRELEIWDWEAGFDAHSKA